MRKKLFAICLSVVVAIVLLAVFVPSCTPTTGTIEVKATLDGSPWSGAVSYNLTGPGTPPTGTTSVPKSFTVDPGSWNCTYVSGGPPDAYFVNITPSETQSVSAGGNITFTLNFASFAASPLDASTTFVSWTINGVQVPPGVYLVHPNDIIDVEYKVHASGAQGATVTVKETSWLQVHYTGGGPYGMVTIHAVNAWGAVSMNPPATKLSQMTTIEGVPAPYCTTVIAYECEPVKLDVETEWKLVICNNYTKSINWLSFPSAPNILFDLQVPEPIAGAGTYNLTAWSCVDLDRDTDPSNDCTGNSTITIQLMP
ncbi:MAG: hypothetical protein MUO61_01680 [Dehalococcoidia bacterium]|nr:hypothetical protein [Dehalococcoidia bacterium]